MTTTTTTTYDAKNILAEVAASNGWTVEQTGVEQGFPIFRYASKDRAIAIFIAWKAVGDSHVSVGASVRYLSTTTYDVSERQLRGAGALVDARRIIEGGSPE